MIYGYNMGNVNKKELAVRQAKFIQEYLIDPNATQAAIKAGYNKRSAYTAGARLLANDEVIRELEEAKRIRSEKTGIDANWILLHCSNMLKADIADILDDVGAFKPIKQWPLIWRQMLSGMDVKELYDLQSLPDGDGKIKVAIGIIKKLKFVTREKILELTGKHVDVNAFKELHEHTGKDGGPIEYVESNDINKEELELIRSAGLKLNSENKLIDGQTDTLH